MPETSGMRALIIIHRALQPWPLRAACLFAIGCADGSPAVATRPLPNASFGSTALAGRSAQLLPSGAAAIPQAITPVPMAAAPPSTPSETADAGALPALTPCDAGSFCPAGIGDRADCGQLELTARRETVSKGANVLVVFDRSTSMDAKWEGTPKYQAAGNALLTALTPLREQLTVGGVFFPSAAQAPPQATCPNGCDPGNLEHWLPTAAGCCLSTTLACSVSPIGSSDQIDFTTAEAFGRGLPAQWQLPGATGTPLEAGLVRAAEAVAARHFSEPLLVVVMTDGEPNCGTDPQHVIDQVAAWRKSQITTYVVGLPGAKSAAQLLNTMAQAGGTQNYIEPRDPKELEARLRTVLSSSVRTGWNSCSFHLEPKAPAPDRLRLFVTQNGHESEVPRGMGPGAGNEKGAQWTVDAEGAQVNLQGQLCTRALAGDITALRFVFGCPELERPVPDLQ